MRKWIKYDLGLTPDDTQISIDRNFSEHAAAMGGYEIDQSYSSDDLIFKKFFFGFHEGRLECYYDFISKNLSRDAKILSIASGRGILEYYMKKNGYQSVDCSDLENNGCCTTLGLNFRELNILDSPSEDSYDAVICLSLIYLFDNNQLSLFFENVHKKLNKNGILILDSAGSPDTFFSHLMNEIFLYIEIWFYRIYKSCMQKKWYHITKKHFGYRRTDDEILSIARKNGFNLEHQENFHFFTDFRRSMLFRKVVKPGSNLETLICRTLGKGNPYIRLFKFHSEN